MAIPTLLNLEKSRQERERQEFKDKCDEISKLVREKVIEFGWSYKQFQYCVNTVLPEVVSVEVNNFLVESKLK